MKAVIYCRTSTSQQSTNSQMKPLMEYCQNSQYDLIDVIEDTGVSGSKKGRSREGMKKVMEMVNKRLVDVVVVYSVDRIGRNLTDVVSLVEELTEKNVGLVIYKNGVDTTTTFGRQMVSFFALVASMELDFIRSRIKDGIAASSKKGGRRPISDEKIGRIKMLRAEGGGMNRIAKHLRVGNSQVLRVCRQ